MRVVDAFWEKRNLGVEAVSFYIDTGDTLEAVIAAVRNEAREYQTAIIDSARTDILLELQNNGFRFIECALSLSAPVDKMSVPTYLKRFETQLGYRPATKEEIEQIKDLVRNGEIFKTDKISLDPAFGVKKAGERYSFWIEDLRKSGNTVFAITYKDEIIAFEIAGISEGNVEYHLGGMLPSKAGRMLGAAISLPGTLFWKNHGAKRISTVVSSNNLPILKIHESFGLEIVDCKYVLIKHSEHI